MSRQPRSRQAEVQAALAALPDEYLECRAARRHDFPFRKAQHLRMRDEQTGRDMREITHTCRRCRTKRVDLYWESTRRQRGGQLVVEKMEKIKHQYLYPDEYLVLGMGLDAFDGDDIMLEMIRRFPGEVLEAA